MNPIHSFLPRCFFSLLFLFCALPLRAETLPPETFFVAPHGKKEGIGSREDPLATIEQALALLPPEEGGTIALLGGIYTQTVDLPETTDAGPLLITAAPGEEVIFEGGTKITQWEPAPDAPGLFIVHAPDRKTMFGQHQWFEIWENGNRVRYNRVPDAASVAAWPGSVTFLEGERLLLHPSHGGTPKGLDLWHNQQAQGWSIERSNTTVRGITLRNYLGGAEARAVTIGRTATDVTMEKCQFINSSIGVSTSGTNVRIEHCEFREVGMGLRHAGLDLSVRHCLFQSAAGPFAFHDFIPALRDALRMYYPAKGITFEHCVTAGFWAGIYIKTDPDEAHPCLIRHNTFTDGIRSGAIDPQPHSRYIANIVGPTEPGVADDGVAPNGRYLEEIGAKLEGNYFYGKGGEARGSNLAGPEPFVDLAAGKLALRKGVALPAFEGDRPPGAGRAKVSWSKHLAAKLTPPKVEKRPFAFVGTPLATASNAGALIIARFTHPAQGTLRYRLATETQWHTAAGRDHSQEGNPSLLFALIEGELEAESDYEFEIEALGPKGEKVTSDPVSLRTEGGPKEIRASVPDGLQAALDRALPGDTVVLEKGVYTRPALLNHGGTPEAPLTLRGAGKRETILDGGRKIDHLLRLNKAHHVVIRGLQIRWFREIGLHAVASSYGTLEDCWISNNFLDATGGASGENVLLADSPHWKIRRSIFTGANSGVSISHSPGLTFENNTAFGNLGGGLSMAYSSRGSRLIRNTLNFTGNDSFWIVEKDPAAFASLVAEENNYGSLVKMENKYPENRFTPASHYGHINEAKRIGVYGPIPPERKRIEGLSEAGFTESQYLDLLFFYRMDDWRQFSGKDRTSIFADPLFANPRKGDFRLLPGSPNLLPDGGLIGAEPAAKQP